MWCYAPAILALRRLRQENFKFKVEGREGKSGKGGGKKEVGQKKKKRGREEEKGESWLKMVLAEEAFKLWNGKINNQKNPENLILNDFFLYQYKSIKKYKFSLNILPLSDYQEVLFPETVTTTLTNWKEIPSPSSELTQGLLTPNFWPNRKVQPRRHSKNFLSTGHNTNKLLFHSCFNLKNSFRFPFFFSPISQLIKHLINQVLV